MIKRFAIKVGTHPLFIGAALSIMLVLIVDPEINRYKVKVIEKILTPGITQVYYSDLDGDGESEEIEIDPTSTLLKIILLDEKLLVSQNNLRSQPLDHEYVYAGDCNGDGIEEIYLLTLRGDSILLNILDSEDPEKFMLTDRLVYHNDTIHFDLDVPTSHIAGLFDFQDGRGKTLIFSISAGYSKLPRSIYRYDIARNELMVSPEIGVALYQLSLFDVDLDSVPEILVNTSATGNFHTYIPFSDHSSWLMVLDKDLQFFFDPVEFEGYPSNLEIAPFRDGDSILLAVLHDSYGNESDQPRIYLFNHQGCHLNSRSLARAERGQYFLTSDHMENGSRILLLNARQGKVTCLDKNLEVAEIFNTPVLFRGKPLDLKDLDQDGLPEYIFTGEKYGTFAILTRDLKHPLVVDLDAGSYPFYFTQVIRAGQICFYAQFEDMGYILQYDRNPLYSLKIPMLLFLYALTSFLVFVIYRMQKFRANQQFLARNKIIKLQILALKNQIDPHFTFNVLNNIGSLYATGKDHEKGYDIFVRYARMLRQTIQHSDQIFSTLKEEIEFIQDYIALEQFRSKDLFGFEFISTQEVDLETRIPRMLIHSFVENSIKHGIRQMTRGGELRISVTRHGRSHCISVRDNGPGLSSASSGHSNGTGKGLVIVNELINLFNTLERTKISYTLNDLASPQGTHGTEAVILIPD